MTTTFTDIETRLRRFLRDPNAKIWSQDLLLDLFNQAQRRFVADTRVLETISAIHYPGQLHYAVCHGWERENLTASTFSLIRTMFANYSDYACTNDWEVDQVAGYTSQHTDNGARITQPWETYIPEGIMILNQDILSFPDDFDDPIMVCFDKERLEPIEEEVLKSQDMSYRTKSGEPTWYYRLDKDEQRLFVMYPRPSEVVWDETPSFVTSISGSYTHTDFEADEMTGDMAHLTLSAGTYEVIFLWERSMAYPSYSPASDANDPGLHVTNNWDIDYINDYGQVVALETTDEYDVESSDGTIVAIDDQVFDNEAGIVVDYISMDNNIFLMYKPRIQDLTGTGDTVKHFADWMVKYIERYVCSLAYLTNTDAYNTNLSDVWFNRYVEGLSVITRFKALKQVDRRPALKTDTKVQYIPHLRLPDHYPRLE